MALSFAKAKGTAQKGADSYKMKDGENIVRLVGGILPRAEAEKDAGGKTIGSQAGLMARFCRKVVPLLKINEVAMVAINHEFVDIMTGKIMSSGGKKFAYHKSISIRMKQKFGVTIKQGDRKVVIS